MKFLTKILAFTFLLTFGSIILFNQGASANEIDSNGVELQSSNSIAAATYIDESASDFDKGLVWFPKKIWYTRGDYGGYLYVSHYEELRNDVLRAHYKGTLYLNAVPLKLDPEVEES